MELLTRQLPPVVGGLMVVLDDPEPTGESVTMQLG